MVKEIKMARAPKTYKNYFKNQSLRRSNPNILKIKNGQPVTFKKPVETEA